MLLFKSQRRKDSKQSRRNNLSAVCDRNISFFLKLLGKDRFKLRVSQVVGFGILKEQNAPFRSKSWNFSIISFFKDVCSVAAAFSTDYVHVTQTKTEMRPVSKTIESIQFVLTLSNGNAELSGLIRLRSKEEIERSFEIYRQLPRNNLLNPRRFTGLKPRLSLLVVSITV